VNAPVVSAIIGGAATVIAALIGLHKARGMSRAKDGDQSSPLSIGGNVRDAIVGSTGVTVDRRNIVNIQEPQPRRHADLQVVDVRTHRDEQFRRTLDVKLRNNGDEVVFVKRADFTVVQRWNIPDPGVFPHAVPVSATYDADLASGRASVALSQAVEPNGVDRFVCLVGASSTDPDQDRYPFLGLFLYLVQIELLFNETSERLVLPLTLLELPCPRDFQGLTTVPARRAEIERNKETAIDVRRSIGDDVVIDPEVMAAVQSWADIDPSTFPG
jgi:hypothetical protein